MTDELAADRAGVETARMVEDALADGMQRGILLMRHSARTFLPDIHDLENRLTPHGRALAARLGQALPEPLSLRGYASPAHRCVETAELMLEAHAARGGAAGRTRAAEGLGVFYALDQQKMWLGMREAGGLAAYVQRWFEDDVPADAMMPAPVAVQMLLRIMAAKLGEARPAPSLDVCVTHDMTVYTVRHGAGLESADGPGVEFLDGLLLYAIDDKMLLRSHHGGEVSIPALH